MDDIPCKKYGCLRILIDLMEKRADMPGVSGESTISASDDMRGMYDCFRFYNKLREEGDPVLGHFIERRLNKIRSYLDGDSPKKESPFIFEFGKPGLA